MRRKNAAYEKKYATHENKNAAYDEDCGKDDIDGDQVAKDGDS